MFAENLANIVWAHFIGRGIVHEVDDVRISNPPSNPVCLAELGSKFGEYGFDFKQIGSRYLQFANVPAEHIDQPDQ